MSSSESRTEVMKPLLIKAAVPTVLSIAAYVCAKIISNRSNSEQNLSSESIISESLECPQTGDQGGMSLEHEQKSNLEDKLLELEVQVEDLQKSEWDSEARFHKYRSLKEKEFMLTEMKNLMVLEKTRAESLLREISSMEEENKRMGELVIEYSKLMKRIEGLRRENGLLKMKARKQWRIAKQKLRVLKNQKIGIEARDSELLRNREELERRDNLIHELEEEVAQLKEVVDHLQREKIELFNRLDFAEKPSDSSHVEIEAGVTKEEYEKVLKELEQLHKDRAEEAKELTYLKWSNACLRHELLRCHEQAKGEKSSPDSQPEQAGNVEPRINREMDECDCMLSGHEDGHCLATGPGSGNSMTTGHVHSRRRRLVQKFKRWVEGGKHEEKEKSEMRCFGTHSVPVEADDQFVHARNSCSSI